MRSVILGLILISSAAFTGCGQGDQVSGSVSFSDGSPLTCGEVVLDSESQSFFGTITPQGSYKVSSIPAGTYQVYINRADSPSPKPDMPDIPLIAKKFTRKADSGLVCTVQGATVFDIQVEKP